MRGPVYVCPRANAQGLGVLPRLLLVKLGDLGDSVLLTPALDALSRYAPEYEVDLLVGGAGAPVFHGDLRVRRLLCFDRHATEGRKAFTPRGAATWLTLLAEVRRGRYDALLLAHHFTTFLGSLKLDSLLATCGARLRVGLDNGRGKLLTDRVPDLGFGALPEAEYWLALVGQLVGMEVYGRLSPSMSAATDGALPPLGESVHRPLVVVHHGLGGWMPSRAWRAEGYARVADELALRADASIVLIGGRAEREAAGQVKRLMRAGSVSLAGLTDYAALAALLRLADLYIGPDSGPMQLAAALGTPTVSLWGPTNERAWAPVQRLGAGPSVCVRAPDRPRPWVYVGHRMGDRTRKLDLGSIDPEMVVQAALRLLEANVQREEG